MCQQSSQACILNGKWICNGKIWKNNEKLEHKSRLGPSLKESKMSHYWHYCRDPDSVPANEVLRILSPSLVGDVAVVPEVRMYVVSDYIPTHLVIGCVTGWVYHGTTSSQLQEECNKASAIKHLSFHNLLTFKAIIRKYKTNKCPQNYVADRLRAHCPEGTLLLEGCTFENKVFLSRQALKNMM